jgi:alpha-tubulin suppressor-like RCC1 family protein
VSAGVDYTCGETTAGVAYCWGDNAFGELGNGTNTNTNVPVAVSGGYTFAVVSAGYGQTCGVATPGATYYCWGNNDEGQVGNGTNTNTNVPVAISLP